MREMWANISPAVWMERSGTLGVEKGNAGGEKKTGGGGGGDFGVTFPKLKLAQETEISSLLEASVFRALVSRCCASSCSSLRYYHNLRTGAGILEVDDEEPCAIVLIKKRN